MIKASIFEVSSESEPEDETKGDSDTKMNTLETEQLIKSVKLQLSIHRGELESEVLSIENTIRMAEELLQRASKRIKESDYEMYEALMEKYKS